MAMDINVTYPIAANVTLIQSGWTPWIIAGISGLAALLGALVGGFSTYLIQRLHIKNNQLERKKQIYSQLNGINSVLVQLLGLFLESKVRSVFHNSQASTGLNMRLTVGGSFKNFDELQRFMNEDSSTKYAKDEIEKAEKYGIQAAQAKKQLGEIIGLIQVSFDDTDELDRLINKVETALMKYYEIFEDPSSMDAKTVIRWKDNILKIKFADYLDKELNPAINALLGYLKNEIKMNQKPGGKFW